MGAELPIGPNAGISVEDFLAYCETRPNDERWQLLEGLAIMMTPPRIVHQRIARNLMNVLDAGLSRARPGLIALQDIGVSVPGIDAFLPIADVAVIDEASDDVRYASRVFLTCEILSPSNTQFEMSVKRRNYVAHPDNLYNLIIDQTAVRVEFSARAEAWVSRVLEGADAMLELPEFGVSVPVRELYRGTALTTRT